MIVNGNIISEMLADTVQEYTKETRNPHHAGIFCGMQAWAKLGSQSPHIPLGVCLGGARGGDSYAGALPGELLGGGYEGEERVGRHRLNRSFLLSSALV